MEGRKRVVNTQAKKETAGEGMEEQHDESRLRRLGSSVASQVPLHLVHSSFRKTYFLDIVADEGVVLELKAAEALNDRHRAQLVNYLFLLELSHGKLINVRGRGGWGAGVGCGCLACLLLLILR
jgi:GxxExxY protein